MKTISVTLFAYLLVCYVDSAPATNGNGAGSIALVNGRSNDEPHCKSDDGRTGIPLGGRIRIGTNPCKVCTCTLTGFNCEEKCETTVASTSAEPTQLTSSTSTSPPTDSSILSSTLPTASSTNVTSTAASSKNRTSLAPIPENLDEDGLSGITGGACARSLANGLTPTREYAFVDCSEVYLAGRRQSGVYEIWPRTSPKPFRVLCDMDTDGGGWTVIQRRGDFIQQTNFFVTWSSYKRGFGDLSRDFWLGNEKIHALTNQDEYRLHIDIQSFTDESRVIDYEWFFITSEQTKYTLNLGRFLPSSTGGDSFTYNRGMRFTTRDQDNDQSVTSQCAENYRSGWWHAGCTVANLNGIYQRGNDSTATGVFWSGWLGPRYSLKSCEMKVRPTGFNSEMLS